MTQLSTVSDGAELVESKTLRSRHVARVDVLDKVATLAMLPGNEWATVKQVAEFYGVSQSTIGSVVEDNRAELKANGYTVLRGAAVNPFRGSAKLSPKARSLAVFTRTAVLNVGMLLTESEVARAVRAYLLAVEATATPEHRATAVQLIRLQERMDYKNILNALKLGGAQSGRDYATVQNALYVRLFDMTASEIRRVQPQRTGEYYKNRPGVLKPSTVAKDYLTEHQLRLLDSAVLAATARLQAQYPNGAWVEDMVGIVLGAASWVRFECLNPPLMGYRS